MKKLLASLFLLFAVPYGLRAQTGQFTAIANDSKSFTWYFIPSQDFTSIGNLTFDVTIEIANTPGCNTGSLTAAPVLATSAVTYSNAVSRSTALGTVSSGGAKTAAGVTPAFWNQRYLFGVASTAGITFTAGTMYPLVTFTMPTNVSSINCIKIIDWNNDKIGSGVIAGAVNGDTHISVSGAGTTLLDNHAALFLTPTTANGFILPNPTLAGASGAAATSIMPLGWDEKPVANPVTQTLSAQPSVDQIVTLNGTAGNPQAQNGSDFEDGALGGSTQTSTVVITQLPDNGELSYNGSVVTANQVIPNFDASLISIKLTGAGYTSTTFKYTFQDSKAFRGDAVDYTLNWGSPLPVILVRFAAAREGSSTQLSWATTAETNSDRFDIQRSANAKDWATIGTKAAAGESKATLPYFFTDAATLAGTNYYRLKMIDKDATFAYSSIKSTEFGDAQKLSIYPNPVSDVLLLKDTDLKTVKELSIISASGITAYKTNAVTAAGISIASLTNGIYIVKITKTDGTATSHKIVVTK